MHQGPMCITYGKTYCPKSVSTTWFTQYTAHWHSRTHSRSSKVLAVRCCIQLNPCCLYWINAQETTKHLWWGIILCFTAIYYWTVDRFSVLPSSPRTTIAFNSYFRNMLVSLRSPVRSDYCASGEATGAQSREQHQLHQFAWCQSWRCQCCSSSIPTRLSQLA